MWGRRFLTAIFSWFSSSEATPTETVMTAEQFTHVYAERAETLLPGMKATIKGALEVHVGMMSHDDDDGVAKVFLENAFREYAENPAEIDAIISRYLVGLRGALTEVPTFTREHLVLVVRREIAFEWQALLHWPLAGDVHAIYAFDAPDTVHYAPKEKLDELGLGESALKALALKNLKHNRVVPRIETHPTFAIVSSGDSYSPSLLLDDDFWSTERLHFRGDIVVIVAANDLVLVTGSQENEGLEAIAEMAHEAAGEAVHAISTTPIVRRDGAWQSFVQ